MKGIQKRFSALLLSVVAMVLPGIAGAEGTGNNAGKLDNGSFEKDQTFTSDFIQPDQKDVPSWNTTAFQGKIELFKKNTNIYIPNVTLEPTNGTYAAELNADEESTLYQIVETEPSSLYEWGLDHGSRSRKDTMALIIGPKQSVNPSKPNKNGRDQFMQMVDWLKKIGKINDSDVQPGIIYDGGQAITLYSKKFDARGGFVDNEDQKPFSLTNSAEYTEEWKVWIMADEWNTSGTNRWTSYGQNASSNNGSENTVDLSKYYLYKVPSGQTQTIFAFVSVETQSDKGESLKKTYGNFLDRINFNLYRSLTGSTTPHGSAVVIESSSGSSSGTEGSGGHEVTVDNDVKAYVPDGTDLTIRALINSGDKETVSFAGVYYTRQTENGIITEFVANTGGNWTQKTDDDGNIIYEYQLHQVTSAIDLHFVFIKSPLITYDANGGETYYCQGTESFYNFEPKVIDEGLEYIDPYTSRAATGHAGWRFLGWMLFDDDGIALTELLPGVHRIACNYKPTENTSDINKHEFIVIGEGGSFTKTEADVRHVKWEASTEPLYKKEATGLTLVAQWRWKQTMIPMTREGAQGYSESQTGGTVTIRGRSNEREYYASNENGKGSEAYYAEADEMITATASPNEGYNFDGWYDEDGKLVSTQTAFSYAEIKESVKTYYARFSKKYTVKFERKVQESGHWRDVEENDNIPTLTKAEFTEAYGKTVSCKASKNEGASYGFLGWYDKDRNLITEEELLSREVLGNATYYAIYTRKVTVEFKKQLEENRTLTPIADNDNNIGQLTTYSESLVVGGQFTSIASLKDPNYVFVGWYDGDSNSANLITQGTTLSGTAAETNTTYYARFKRKGDNSTWYTVKHRFVAAKTDLTDDIRESVFYVQKDVKIQLSVMDPIPYPLYSCQTIIVGNTKYDASIIDEEFGVSDDGSTVFELIYKKPAQLIYQPNPPAGVSASNTIEPTNGYVGDGVNVTGAEYKIAGYTFTGWNTLENGNGTKYSAHDVFTLRHDENGENPNVLYAQWTARTDTKYQIQHIKLKKDGTEAETAETDDFSGKTGTLINAEGETKNYPGYTFDKDNQKNILTGSISGDGLLVLKLYYKPNSITLTYKPNGGVGDDKTISDIVVDERVALIANPFQRENYSFTGWNTQADGTGTGYQPNYLYWMEADVTHVLYAQWTEKDKTRLTYDANGGTGDMAAKEGYVDAKVKVDANQFNRSGYTFTGWNTQADGKGTEYDSGDDYTLLANVDNANPNKLYAQWKANTDTEYTVEHYKLSADKSQATKVEADTQTLYGTTDTEVDATRQQKSYPGYTYDAEKSEGTVKGVIRGDGALVLKLYYAPDETTLTYKPNYDCSDPDVVENNLHVDETVTLAGDLFTRAGYTLTGWNTQASGGGRAFMKGAQYTMRPNANSVNPNVLYAQWAANTTTPYTVEHHKLNSRGEVVSSEVEHLTGTTDTTVEAVVKYYPGYLMDPNHAEHKKEGVVTADGKLVLRLFYVPQSAVLIYKPNGGVGADVTQAGHVHEGVTIRENPFLRVGYAFTGWNTLPDGSGTAYAPGGEIMLVEGELILYAQWESVPPVIPPEDADLPKTGDRTHLTVWLLLLAASSSLLLALVLSGGKRGREAGGRRAAGQSQREDAT